MEAARSTKAFVEVTDKGFDTKGITPLARLNVEPRGFGGEGGRGSNNRSGEQSGRNNGDDRPASERWGHTGGGYAVKREGTGPHVGSLPPAGEKLKTSITGIAMMALSLSDFSENHYSGCRDRRALRLHGTAG